MGVVSYLIFFAIVVSILGIMTLGLNLQWGSTGVFNAGVVGFYAIGGYTFAILTANRAAGIDRESGSALDRRDCRRARRFGLCGPLVGLATMKLRGDYLAIATFGIAVTIQLVALNWESLTGGSLGLTSIPRPLSGFFDTSLSYNLFYLALSLGSAS